MTPVNTVRLVAMGAALTLTTLICDSALAGKQSLTNFKPRSNLFCLSARSFECPTRFSGWSFQTRRSALRATTGPVDIDPGSGQGSGDDPVDEQPAASSDSPPADDQTSENTNTQPGDQNEDSGSEDSGPPAASDSPGNEDSPPNDGNGHGNDPGHAD